MIDVYVKGLSIDIGRQGENLARNIYFDLSELINTYGEGTATLVHMRPSDKAPYVCTVTRSDTFLIWAPTSTDTAYAGSGKCELRWVVGETLAKSIIYTTQIAASIVAGETMPDQYQSWYEQLLAQIQEYTIATQRIDALNARVDSFVALEDGSTTGDAELIDARIGHDGTVYASLGAAIRTQAGELDDSINSMTLDIDPDDGLLYLYVNGVKQGMGIEIGGSSTRYTITYNLAANMESSNTQTKVYEGKTYTTTISSRNVDYQIDDITVTMGSTDITATVLEDDVISIPSVTGDVTITVTALYYPSVETEDSTLTITSGGTGTLKVKLHAEPTQTQTVTLYSESLTLSESTLTFTTSNWDTYQTVTVTTPSVDTTTYSYILLTNSDPLMTETTVMATVKELGYEDLVDTTIPTTDQHVLTLDDFDSTANTTIDGESYVRLYGYNGSYSNVVMPVSINGKKTLTCGANAGPSAANSTFYGNTTIEYVTFENGCRVGEGGAPSGNSAANIFSKCTNLIGVSNFPVSATYFANAFNGCTKLRFVDNLDKLVNTTNLKSAFDACSALEYIQDLSGLTKMNNVQATFRASGLKKIFGLPNLNTTTANATNIYSGCASLQYGIIPKGVSNCAYAFYNCTSLRRVDIFEDNLATSALPSTCFSGCRNLKVYCNAGTTTYNSLITNFGSSTQITIIPFGGSNLPSIVVWGDSISSPNKAWIEWPKRLATKLGTTQYVVKNEAIAGEGSTSTTARQGGYVITVSEAFQIPADTTAVALKLQTVTLAGTEIWSTAPLFSCAGSYNPCTIAGVSGTLSRSGAQYYFKRLSAGDAVNVSVGATVTSNSDTTYNAAGNVMLFYLNGNAGWDNDADKLLEMFQNAVDHFEALGGTDYIVAGPAANSELTKANIMAEVQSFEAMAATAFGNHWLNLREYEIANGLTQNGLTASALDTTRMAAGLVPASLVGGGSTSDIHMYDGETYTDQNHPNVYGANTIMLAFYEKGVELGYWT